LGVYPLHFYDIPPAGSKVGETIVKVTQKIRDKTVEIAKNIGGTIKTGFKIFCREAETKISRGLKCF